MVRYGTCTERGLTLSPIIRQFTAGTATSKGLNFATSSPSATSVGGAGLGNSPVSLYSFFFVYLPFYSHYIIVSCAKVCHTLYSVQKKVRATRDGRKYYDNWQSDFAPNSRSIISLTAQSPAIPSLHVSSEAATCPSQPKIQIFQSLIVLSTVSQLWQQCLTTIAIWHSPYARTARHQQLLYGGEMKSAPYSATPVAFSSSSTVALVR
jgi:hypothetical protein